MNCCCLCSLDLSLRCTISWRAGLEAHRTGPFSQPLCFPGSFCLAIFKHALLPRAGHLIWLSCLPIWKMPPFQGSLPCYVSHKTLVGEILLYHERTLNACLACTTHPFVQLRLWQGSSASPWTSHSIHSHLFIVMLFCICLGFFQNQPLSTLPVLKLEQQQPMTCFQRFPPCF